MVQNFAFMIYKRHGNYLSKVLLYVLKVLYYVRKLIDGGFIMIFLLIVVGLLFCYLGYVLINPEKF